MYTKPRKLVIKVTLSEKVLQRRHDAAMREARERARRQERRAAECRRWAAVERGGDGDVYLPMDAAEHYEPCRAAVMFGKPVRAELLADYPEVECRP